MESKVFTVLFTIFVWWFSTGLILYAIRRVDYSSKINHKSFTFYCLPLLIIGIFGFIFTINDLTTHTVYISFVSSLFIWGWFEIAFLSGLITGKVKFKCEEKITGWKRFVFAWKTINHSELALIAVTILMFIIVHKELNNFGFLTFSTLYVARVCAKINFYLGVPYINFDFFPKPISYMKSLFKIRSPSFFWILSVALLFCLSLIWAQNSFSGDVSYPSTIGYVLISSLTFLALFEHLCMVIPFTETRLWLWMLPKKQKNEN